jgi:hypothetical protein
MKQFCYRFYLIALLFGSLFVLGGILAFNVYKDPFAEGGSKETVLKELIVMP